jgi:hypothetical protein
MRQKSVHEFVSFFYFLTVKFLFLCRIYGFVSTGEFTSNSTTWKGLSSTSQSHIQFLYINKRSVDLPKISKTINDIYKTFYPNFGRTNQQPHHQHVNYVLNFELPTGLFSSFLYFVLCLKFSGPFLISFTLLYYSICSLFNILCVCLCVCVLCSKKNASVSGGITY